MTIHHVNSARFVSRAIADETVGELAEPYSFEVCPGVTATLGLRNGSPAMVITTPDEPGNVSAVMDPNLIYE